MAYMENVVLIGEENIVEKSEKMMENEERQLTSIFLISPLCFLKDPFFRKLKVELYRKGLR